VDELLSAAAARVVAVAARRAALLRKTAIEPGDLIAGLAFDPDSHSGVLLRKGCRDVERLLEVSGADDPALSEGEVELPLDPVAAIIVRRAKELAVSVGSQDAGTQELLLAALECWSEADAFCTVHGVSRHAIAEDYRRRAPPAEPIRIDDTLCRLDLDRGGEQTDVARILDANLNRAREGLRVMEDYARFVLDDASICSRLKNCRHALRDALEYMPPDWLIAARDTDGDVGTAIGNDSESRRSNLSEVVAANCKRAEEAVRTLEELAKLDDGLAAQKLEAVRYEIYTLEHSLRTAERANRRLDGVRLYWLLDPGACRGPLEETVREAIAGGVDAVQLRDKTSSDRELLRIARDLRRWTRECGALLFVNDRPDLARAANADGVHLGQEDLPVKEARRIVGPDALIGLSTHTIEQARRAVAEGADYIGAGPVFPSRTKQFTELMGLGFVEAVAREIRLPSFCIGGIEPANIAQVAQVGAKRFAVGAAISQASDPREIARELLRIASGRA
jgi:thiamine-phosphate pyrophosphorylase